MYMEGYDVENIVFQFDIAPWIISVPQPARKEPKNVEILKKSGQQ